MSKRHHKNTSSRPPGPAKRAALKPLWLAVGVFLAVGGLLVAMKRNGGSSEGAPTANFTSPTNAKPIALPTAAAPAPSSNAIPSMEAAQSVVVTHDLDYGSARPRLAEIMKDIDRRHQAEDGFGRTFAILEAFNGEVQPDGKIRVSLRVSTEKSGAGEIVFKKTGESLWKSRVTAATHQPAFTGGSLTILLDDGTGKSFTVDGSTGPASIFSAMLKESSLPVAQAWPDGADRELAFIYSSCGCPVKVACRRMGDRTIRTKESAQVIFPDDPAAVQVINRLMGW